jgi:lipid A ethanolaminephosphotransferase
LKISPAPPDGRDFDKRGLSGTHLVLAGSLFLLLTGNLAFFQQLTQTYPWGGANAAFLISVVLVLGCEIVLLTLLLSLVIPLRVTLSLLFLITAVAAYFSDQFGTIIDTVMIGNTLQTSTAEAADLLTVTFGLRVLLLGFVPIALIWSMPFRRVSYARALRSKLLLALASVVLLVACILLFGSQYASFAREHKAFRF